MIRSMTGFCRTDTSPNNFLFSIEIKSVNHRFLDIRTYLPKQFQQLEDGIKKKIKERISRGRIDLYVQLKGEATKNEKLTVDLAVWENIKSVVHVLEKDMDRKIDLGLANLLSIRDLIVYQQIEEFELGKYEETLMSGIDRGIEELIRMKEREGEILYDEILEYQKTLKKQIDQIPQYLNEALANYGQRLRKNIESMQIKYDQDDPRIAQEIGIYLDRIDITEEIGRFNAHLVQLSEVIDSVEPVGRKLDFILQELNREANTICSKSNHISITQIGVELKSGIEKIREQIQNVE